jgi:hypothetical protein
VFFAIALRTLAPRPHRRHAQGKTSTSAGTSAFLARFEREVDPEGVLPLEERARRAEYARKAHFADLALKSARARRGRVAKAADTPEAA